MAAAKEQQGAWRVGSTILGKYRLDSVLGEGGMAIVYVATHRNNKRFAVKILHTELSRREDVRARFLKEGYVANSVQHGGAVAVVDDDIAEDGAAFLVMELLEGSPLDSLQKRFLGRRYPLDATLVAMYELLDVLASAHERGIVHRDLKPANLFVTKEGALKVLDFGIARIREAAVANESDHATKTGMMLGTPAFLPPEQAKGKSSEMDARTDLWAVGATMFRLLSGKAVHKGESPTETLILAATAHARSLRTVLPDAPEPLVALVDHSLAFDKINRFQTAQEFRAAIANLYRELFRRAPSREVLAQSLSGPVSSSAALTEVRDDSESSKPANPSQTGARTGSTSSSSSAAEESIADAATEALSPTEARRKAIAEAQRPKRSMAPFVVAGVVGALALGGGLFALKLSAHADAQPIASASASAAPSVTASAETPISSATAPTASAIVAPPEQSVFVTVEPAGVKVEVDGRPTPVEDGGVMISGVIGSAHHVRITEKWQDTLAEVGITARGPVPAKLRADPLGPKPKTLPSAKPKDPALDGKFER